MGAWSHEPFGNDTACDWVYGLEESTGFGYIEEALDRVLECGDDYLEAPDSEEAIAAVEVIAKLLGKGTQENDAVDAWVDANRAEVSAALLQKAQQVLDRIVSEGSELLELWQESGEDNAWLPSMEKLRAAVSS